MRKAIKKYGKEAFTKEILFDFDNPKEMNAKEAEIVDADFLARSDTYNLSTGGTNPLSGMTKKQRKELARSGMRALRERYYEDPELKAKMDRVTAENGAKAPPPPDWTGKSHKTSTKKKISRALKEAQGGSRNSQYGTRWVYREKDGAKKIPATSLESYLEAGWLPGRKAPPKEGKPRKRGPQRGQGASKKLTQEQVCKIRSRYSAEDVTQAVLAQEYQVSQKTISQIVNRRTW